FISFAQEVKLELSLEEARRIAVENNPDFNINALEVDIAKETQKQAALKRIPQIYGDFNLQQNLIIPSTPVPAKAFDPNAGDDELMLLRFTTKWTSNIGVNASYDLFNPSLQGAVKEAAIESEIKETDHLLAKNQLLFDVGDAYYACLVALEQVRLAEVDSLSKFKIAEMTQKQFDAGRATLPVLNEVKLAQNNSRSNFQEASKILKNSKEKLLVLLGYSPTDPVKISFQKELGEMLSDTETSSSEEHLSLNLRKLQQQSKLAEIQLNTAKNGFLPTLSLNGYYGSRFYDNSFQLFKGGNWFGNSFINIGLRVPITEGIDRIKKISQLKIQQQIIAESIRSQRNKQQLDINTARDDVDYYEQEFKRKKENIAMAEENLKLATQQYEKGRILISDYYNGVYTFQKERTAYLESLYKLFVSKLSLEKASMD
ncbi:MAG TPA: TolC family protein, partial [Sphingobacteriaceae bacterium]|nr:TolC family protein [Sphingobacteriaceae bacterium]